MARRPLRSSHSNQIFDAFQNFFGSPKSAQALGQTFTATARYCQELGDAIVSTSKDSSKKMTQNSVESIDSVITAMDKGIEQSTKRAKKHIDDLHKHVAKRHKESASALHQIHGHVEKSHSIGRKVKSFAVDEFSEAIKDLAEMAVRFAPAITTFVSLAMTIKTLIESVVELDGKVTALSMNFGGNVKASKELLVKSYEEVITSTNQTRSYVEDLGRAFFQAGISIVGNADNLVDYMKVASNLNRVFGTTNEDLARYTKTLQHSGMTANQVFKSYDDAYRMMQTFQLTTADLNASLSEGDTLWSAFGSVTSKTLDQIQKDVLDTKGLFKAFNLDVKKTGDLMSGIMGDQKAQRRQAALIAAMKGINVADAFINLATGNKQGPQDLMESIVRFATSHKGLQYGRDDQELRGSLSSEKYAGILMGRQNLEKVMSEMFSVSPQFISRSLSDWTGYISKHKSASIDDWIGKRLVQSSLPGNPGGVNDALAAKNNSIEGTMTKLNNAILGIADHISYFVLEQMPVVTRFVNDIVDMFHMQIQQPPTFETWRRLQAEPVNALSNAKSKKPVFNKGPLLSGSTYKDPLAGMVDFVTKKSSSITGGDNKIKNWASLIPPPPSGKTILPEGYDPNRTFAGLPPLRMMAVPPTPTGAGTMLPNMAEKIAKSAESTAKAMNTVGSCALGVRKAFGKVGIKTTGNALSYTSQLSKNPHFERVTDGSHERGDIDVYQPNPKGGRTKGQKKYGHVEVYLGDLKSASDHIGRTGGAGSYGRHDRYRYVDNDKQDKIASLLEQQNKHLEKLVAVTTSDSEKRDRVAKELKLKNMGSSGDAKQQQQIVHQSIV